MRKQKSKKIKHTATEIFVKSTNYYKQREYELQQYKTLLHLYQYYMNITHLDKFSLT